MFSLRSLGTCNQPATSTRQRHGTDSQPRAKLTHLPEADLREWRSQHLIYAQVLRKVKLQGSWVSHTEWSSSMKYICIHTLFLPMLSSTEQFLFCGKHSGKLEVEQWPAGGEAVCMRLLCRLSRQPWLAHFLLFGSSVFISEMQGWVGWLWSYPLCLSPVESSEGRTDWHSLVEDPFFQELS